MHTSASIEGARVLWRDNHALWWIVVIGTLQLGAGVGATVYGWPVALAPIVAVTIALGMTFPRIGFIILMLAMFSKQSLPGTVGIYASDVLSVPVMAGALLRILSQPRLTTTVNPLLSPLLAIGLYFGITTLWATHTVPAMVNWMRHVQLIVLCLLIVESIEIEDIPKIIGVMVFTTIALSLFTIQEFAATSGRQRVFGPTGWFFTTFLAMSMTHASVGAILSSRAFTRILWVAGAAVCFLGIIATQTRSAMLQALLGIMIAVACAWLWSRWNRNWQIRRRIITLVLLTVAMFAIFLFGQILLFEAASDRVEQALEGRSNTIYIRLLLWKMGWAVFLDSPMFGVGLGQASRWSESLNFFHLDPVSPGAAGLGVHNDAITYLAETGVVGTGLILWLFWVVTRMGWRVLRAAKEEKRLYQLLVLFAPAGAIIAHYFYSAYLFYSIGGMVVAFYFAMLARLYRAWENQDEERRTQVR